MNPEKIQEAYAQKRKAEEDKKKTQEENSNRDKSLLSGDLIQKAVIKSAAAQIEAMASHEPKVEVKNLSEAVDAINKLNLTSFTTSQPRIADMIENLEKLSVEMAQLSEKFKEIGFEPVANALTQLLKQIDGLPKKISDITVKIERDKNVEKALKELNDSINKIEFKPDIQVKVPDIRVPKIDVSPIVEVLREKEVEKEELDISEFMVQNQENEETMQYFGLVHPSGAWMIIQNEVETGNYSYAFGSDNYNFADRANLEYGSVTGINALRS